MKKYYCIKCEIYWYSFYPEHIECPFCKGEEIIVDEKNINRRMNEKDI